MPSFAIAPSPVARLLLDLSERAASGGIEVGGRRLVLAKGAIVEVRPAPEDASLGDFLVAAGRLSAENLASSKKQMSEQRSSLEAVLRHRDLVPADVLLETRRALWLDRFVRGLAQDEQEGRQPAQLTPEPHPAPGPAVTTLSFVLDALARRAGFGDAEQVGRNAQSWFDWLPSSVRKRATDWADLGEVEEAIPASALFARHPAAPSRIAALVRAGLARLTESRPSLPPPLERTSTVIAPAPLPTRIETSGSIAPPALQLLAALEPGQARANERPFGIDPVESWFPPRGRPLDDPLDPIERHIAALEQMDATPSERAAAWLSFARTTRVEHESVEEAERACREAAAATPHDPIALDAAAELSSAMGHPELAYSYAVSSASFKEDAQTRAATYARAADFALRADKAPSALKALRLAAEAAPDDPIITERLARMLGERGSLKAAVRGARAAAEKYRVRSPERAAALLYWAASVAPNDLDLTTDLASILASTGCGEAAAAVLARAAQRTSQADDKKKLYTNAYLRAELSARPDLAADLLLEARRAGAAPDGCAEALLSQLSASGATLELLLTATELAREATATERADLLVRAAEARLELAGDCAEAVELLTQAVLADDQHDKALTMLEHLSSTEQQPHYLIDALERRLRSDEASAQAKLRLLPRYIAAVSNTYVAPQLERWAYALSARLGGPGPSATEQRAFEARLAKYEAELRALEQELRQCAPDVRAQVGLAVAEYMRDDPARRSKARKLYEKVLDVDTVPAKARGRFIALLRLEGDEKALRNALEAQAKAARGEAARGEAELALAGFELEHGAYDAALERCRAVLERAPRSKAAILFLQRLAELRDDSQLLRDALERRAAVANDPRERARVLTRLAFAYRAASDLPAAIARAEAALTQDPRSAQAALLLVELSDHVEAPRAPALLKAARTVLGDCPELLTKLARAAFATRDGALQLEALEAHGRLTPLDSLPFLGLVALRTTGKNSEALCAAIENALHPERSSNVNQETILAGLERLFQLGAKAEAAELAILACDELGERAEAIVEWAEPLALSLSHPRLSVALMERAVARATGHEKAAKLRKLARLHQAFGAAHREARALLRLLALTPSDPDALERLAYIYATAGDVGRVIAVLTLRLDLATDLNDRREKLIEIALASLVVAEDEAGARELLLAALATERSGSSVEEPPEDLIRRGVGLLLGSRDPQGAFDLLLELSAEASPERSAALLEEALFIAETYLHNPDLALRAASLGLEGNTLHSPFLLHFERLALELGDVATGREVYRHLAETAMGIHGRRAALYRGARWLERAGALPNALELMEQAFMLAPAEGTLLSGIERVARAVGKVDVLARCLCAFAEAAERSDRRADAHLRAADLFEVQLGQLDTAFEACLASFRISPSDAAEARAFACLEQLRHRSMERANELARRWQAMQEERASDAWATSTKVTALISLAQMALLFFETPAATAIYIERARKELAADEDVSELERDCLNGKLNELAAQLPKDTTLELVPESQEMPGAPEAEPHTARENRQPPADEAPLVHASEPEPARAAAEASEAAAADAAAGLPVEARERGVEARQQDEALDEDDGLLTLPGAMPVTPSLHPSATAAPELLTVLGPPANASQRPEPERSAAPGVYETRIVPQANEAARAPAARSRQPAEPERVLAAEPVATKGLLVQRGRLASDSPTALHSAGGLDTGTAARVPRRTVPGIAPVRVVETRGSAREQNVERAVVGVTTPSRRPAAKLAPKKDEREVLARIIADAKASPVRADALCLALLQRARNTSITVGLLRGIMELARMCGRDAVAQVALEALAHVDRSLTPPRFGREMDPSEDAVKGALLEARDDGELSPYFTILAHVCQGVGPLFRRGLTAYGVGQNDFVSPASGTALANALREVSYLLSVNHDTYASPAQEDRIMLAATQPFSIIVGMKANLEQLPLRFRLARAFELARPSSALLASLTPGTAQTLLLAVRAAFGPTDGKAPPVAKEPAAMAAELWRTMPSATQRQVANLFRVAPNGVDHEQLVEALMIRSARVGMIVCRAVDITLANLHLDVNGTRVPRDEAGFDRACLENRTLKAVLAFALSETYLGLREALGG